MYVIEKRLEDGTKPSWLNCVTKQNWVSEIKDASVFMTTELAEQLAGDWDDFYRMKGYKFYAVVTTLEDAKEALKCSD